MKNQKFKKGDKEFSYDDSFFSQYNVPIPENNLLHGDVVHKKHSIWESIQSEEQQKEKEIEIAKKHLKSSEITSICKKCGQTGHFAFECMNTFKMSDKQQELNTLLPSEEEEDEKETKKKKEKKEKKSEKKKKKEKKNEEKKEKMYSKDERDSYYKSKKYSQEEKEKNESKSYQREDGNDSKRYDRTERNESYKSSERR
jgi:outer membrane biosynthesis protein TonB